MKKKRQKLMPDKTPRSKMRAALRQLWLRSRERAAALKRDKYTCVRCGRKQSKAKGRELKVQVHHCEGVQWDDLMNYVYNNLLHHPGKLETLCEECHEEEETK